MARIGSRSAIRNARKQCSGIYLAGVIVAGSRTHEIFIEKRSIHGALIAKDLGKQA